MNWKTFSLNNEPCILCKTSKTIRSVEIKTTKKEKERNKKKKHTKDLLGLEPTTVRFEVQMTIHWARNSGRMDELGFYVPSTVFQSFRDDGRVNMKGSVQWSTV